MSSINLVYAYTVAPTGSVSITPDNQVFEQGTNATLTCNNRGGPNSTITWKVDGDPLSVTGSHQISVFVNASSGGNYTCTVINAAGNESDSTMLFVHPLIVRNPDPLIAVTNGTNVGVTCDAESFPDPMYEWIALHSSAREQITDTDSRNVLQFNPVLFGDEGTYVCRAFITINGTVYDENSTAVVISSKPVAMSCLITINS